MTSEEIERLWIAAYAQLSDESPEGYFARILIGRTRIAVLEEAAKECEQMQKHFDTQDAIDAAEQCALAIRALKD